MTRAGEEVLSLPVLYCAPADVNKRPLAHLYITGGGGSLSPGRLGVYLTPSLGIIAPAAQGRSVSLCNSRLPLHELLGSCMFINMQLPERHVLLQSAAYV